MSYPPLSAQLIVFSRQADLESETGSVLDAVKAAGFGAIECSTGLYAQDPRSLKAMLDERGLVVSACHTGLTQEMPPIFRQMDALDARDLCVSGIGGGNRGSAQATRQDIEVVNGMGRACSKHGFHLHYHNHAWEFATTDQGPTGMELILAHLDPDLADLCVDVAWVHIGGEDPATYLRQHASRVGYVHLKDYVGDRHWVALGQGIVPLGEVMGTLGQLPRVRWVAYEQDTSDRPAAESCAMSRRYLLDGFGYG